MSVQLEVRYAFVKQRRSSNIESAFAGSLQACATFSHIFSVPFIEHSMTKAVLVVHTKARAYSSLWAQDQHKNVSFHSPSHLFIPAFLTKVFSLIKKEYLTTGTFSPVKHSIPRFSPYFKKEKNKSSLPLFIPKKYRGKRDREEKCKAVIFPTTVSVLPLSALLGCEKTEEKDHGERKRPLSEWSNPYDGESEQKESAGTKGQPLHSHVQTLNLFELLI